MFSDRIAQVIETRVRRPGQIAEAAAGRARAASVVGQDGRLVIVAADHPARGTLRAGSRRFAMADRADLLERLCVALGRPGVGGVLGTADVLEDLLLLGALEGKVVIGSMNRGGLAETVFEVDDRFTGYDAAAIARMGFDGGKMLLRIDPERPGDRGHHAGVRPGGVRPGRARAHRHGRAVHRPPGGRPRPQRHLARGDDAGPHHRVRPGHDVGLHVAQGAGRAGHGAGHGRLHPARTAARRRGSRRPRRTRSPAGGRRCGCRTSGGCWPGGRCCTRPTATWPPPSTPRSACSDGAACRAEGAAYQPPPAAPAAGPSPAGESWS